MKKQTNVTAHLRKTRKKRPKQHSKSSKLKTSKRYIKLNKGQG
jgi:hypothetical protein